MVSPKLTYSSGKFVLIFNFYDKNSNEVDFYCEMCDKYFKPKGKCKSFRSNVHKEVDKCKRIKLTNEISDIHNVDRSLYEYIIQHNKKNNYYLIKCHFTYLN